MARFVKEEWPEKHFRQDYISDLIDDAEDSDFLSFDDVLTIAHTVLKDQEEKKEMFDSADKDKDGKISEK